jgi:long-chain acyl-CoA synthetase
VAICLPASPELLIHLFAVMDAGGLAVPMDVSVHQDATAVMMQVLDPHLIIGPTEAGAAAGQACVESGASWRFHRLARVNPGANQARLGIFTSGSTGLPKCVLLSRSNLLAGVTFVRDAHAITASDTAVCCMPLSHINGVVTTVLTPLITGGTVVLFQGSFSAPVFVNLLRDYRATWFSAAPTHYRMLLYPDKPPQGLDACRFGRSASAPLDPRVQNRFEELFGIPVIETMGLTECAGQVFANPMALGERKVGSVGRPFGNEAQVVDAHDHPLPDGETGEIRVRGPNVMLGYLGPPEATAEVLRGGWFYTGDLGYRDAGGFFFITGRKKLIAIFSGINISLVAVEQAARSVSFVEDAAAVASADASFGEVVDLYYTGGGQDLGREDQEIREQVIRVLPHHRAIKRIACLRSLPRSPSGKILRYQLTASQPDE